MQLGAEAVESDRLDADGRASLSHLCDPVEGSSPSRASVLLCRKPVAGEAPWQTLWKVSELLSVKCVEERLAHNRYELGLCLKIKQSRKHSVVCGFS